MTTDPKHWFLGPLDNALFSASTGRGGGSGGIFPLAPTCDESRSGFYFSPVSRSGIGAGCCDRVTGFGHVTDCDGHVTGCVAGVAAAAAPSPPPTGRGTGADSGIYRREIQLLQPVLRIHDILLWIRIRGSILWIRQIRILSSVAFRMQKNDFFHFLFF